MYTKLKNKIKGFFREIRGDKVKRITFEMFVFLPWIINIVVEALNQRSVSGFFKFFITSFDVFVINLMIIYAVFSVTLLLKKRIPAMILLSIIWLGCGIANFIVKFNRETPFNFTDLKDFGQVLDVFDKYMSRFQMVLVIALIVAAIIFVIFIWIKSPKYDTKIKYVKNTIIIAVMWILMFLSIQVGQALDRVSVKFPNLTIAYQSYGFTYCYAYGMISVGVDEPEEYTDESIQKIAERIEKTKTVDKGKVQTPNIIFLQLESFIDLTNVIDLELSTEATPNFTSLKKEYTSGYLSVNNVGYGTANTEFEIMTGMNLEDFGPGEFPYKTVLKNTPCESIAYILKDYGYSSHAMHNNTGTFYSRNVVFKNLGYDTYTSLEYMNPKEYTYLGWVKDSILTDEIIKVLDSTEEQDYLYAISVQGHGAYPSDEVLESPHINVVSGIEDDERINRYTYYANQIYEMDMFIGELINALNNYDEEVILVMYGDHLPSLGLTEDDLINHDLYQTEYIVWSNYGFSMENKDIETYQLAARLLQALNIDGGVINKFHQVYEGDDDYLTALQKLEYDILYADRYVYGGTSPYVATDMQMGTYPIKITNIYPEDENNPIKRPDNETEGNNQNDNGESNKDENNGNENNDNDKNNADSEGDSNDNNDDSNENEFVKGYVVLEGEHFTGYSRVYVNNEPLETIFISENMLLAYYPELKSMDEFCVKQIYKESTEVSTSDKTMYIAPVTDEPV